jgi:hypothetical protein
MQNSGRYLLTVLIVRDATHGVQSQSAMQDDRASLLRATLAPRHNGAVYGSFSSYASVESGPASVNSRSTSILSRSSSGDSSGVNGRELLMGAQRMLRLAGIEVLWAEGAPSFISGGDKKKIDKVNEEEELVWTTVAHQLQPLTPLSPNDNPMLRGSISTSIGADGVCRVDVDGCDCDATHPDGQSAKLTVDHVLSERKHFYHTAILLSHSNTATSDASVSLALTVEDVAPQTARDILRSTRSHQQQTPEVDSCWTKEAFPFFTHLTLTAGYCDPDGSMCEGRVALEALPLMRLHSPIAGHHINSHGTSNDNTHLSPRGFRGDETHSTNHHASSFNVLAGLAASAATEEKALKRDFAEWALIDLQRPSSGVTWELIPSNAANDPWRTSGNSEPQHHVSPPIPDAPGAAAGPGEVDVGGLFAIALELGAADVVI